MNKSILLGSLQEPLTSNPGFVYLPCDAYTVNYIEGNGVKASDLRDYAMHRLARIHPGDIEELLVDVKPAGSDACVLIAKKVRVDEYRTRLHGSRFLGIVRGFRQPFENMTRVVVGPDWYETAVSASGRWTILGRKSRYGQDLMSDITQLTGMLQIICQSEDRAFMKASVRDAAVTTFDDEMAQPRRADAMFQDSQKDIWNVLPIAAFIFAVLMVNIGAFALSASASRAIAEYGERMTAFDAQSAGARKLDEELKAIRLASEAAGPSAKGPGSALLALAKAGEGLELRSFSYDAGRFSIRAKAPHAIRFFESLRAGEGIRDAKLADVRSTGDGREEFSLSGYVDDR